MSMMPGEWHLILCQCEISSVMYTSPLFLCHLMCTDVKIWSDRRYVCNAWVTYIRSNIQAIITVSSSSHQCILDGSDKHFIK